MLKAGVLLSKIDSFRNLLEEHGYSVKLDPPQIADALYSLGRDSLDNARNKWQTLVDSV